MDEIEVKILDINKDEIMKRLEKAGFEKVKDEHQINTIYDFSDLSLHEKKGYARIREITHKDGKAPSVYMTTKIMLSQEKYKIMDEAETLIQDASAGHNIFKTLGLSVRKVLIKDRISYRYGESLIEIDDVAHEEYPFPLLEVETRNEEELKKIVDILGYTMADTTALTMTEIQANHKKALEETKK